MGTTTMPIPIPEKIQRIIDSVTAEMSDDDLEVLSAGDGRLRTSLLITRERLRNPLLAAFGVAFDRWMALMKQHDELIRSGTEEELEAVWTLCEQARWCLLAALRKIDAR